MSEEKTKAQVRSKSEPRHHHVVSAQYVNHYLPRPCDVDRFLAYHFLDFLHEKIQAADKTVKLIDTNPDRTLIEVDLCIMTPDELRQVVNDAIQYVTGNAELTTDHLPWWMPSKRQAAQ